ncbi:RHTO0S09e07844g1_1 [Rhodotorula toruloides]|uniref:RHTO0S09e07844g1_1 n=1 Tax=Rhodotorula toruloides TaxID=5286 RepID=A0A061B5E7_RHOTO|nr:RHTO0S09e07844g1_1 [Rhodotorula toruloides]
MTPSPTNAERTDLGMVGTLSDEETTSQPTGFLSLPDELIARIYASTLALDIRILPMENPFEKWKTAFVNRRIYEIAKPVFLSHIAVDDAGDPVPMVLAFLARQAEPLRTTCSLHLEVEVPLLVLAAALAPRLFPNLTSLTFVSSRHDDGDDRFILPRQATEIIPHFQQLRHLDIECYDSLADETFTLSQLPCLQSLRLRRSTTNELGIQLLRNTTGTALSKLEIYSQDTLPAELSLPWVKLSALTLQFWDEYACYKALRKDLERTKSHRGQFPLRMLDVNAPWKEVSLSSVKAEHPHVKAFVGFLKVVFRRARVSRLKIEGLTSWPPQLELLRNEGSKGLSCDGLVGRPAGRRRQTRLDAFFPFLPFIISSPAFPSSRTSTSTFAFSASVSTATGFTGTETPPRLLPTSSSLISHRLYGTYAQQRLSTSPSVPRASRTTRTTKFSCGGRGRRPMRTLSIRSGRASTSCGKRNAPSARSCNVANEPGGRCGLGRIERATLLSRTALASVGSDMLSC